MQMESSHRSAAMDRSRAPNLKKPRLSPDAAAPAHNRDRAFAAAAPPQRGGAHAAAAAAGASRPRAAERDERDDPMRGRESLQQQQQQQQELVAQYKTALAELTFNSKPIITNLTIIAGENLHAAKAIAATICANVLEVPSEQKLPSLYLLDSIVKNIGRDYIRYFAARLPEVFCKAYNQVDPSIHPSMRHLFGTWKGVFPPAPLQAIEKEIGFQPLINGSSGPSISRPDSQPQRPSHSIHVNPKYLEARQRLQQSTKGREIGKDDVNTSINSGDAVERSDRPAVDGSTGRWTDVLNNRPNMQHPQRDLLNDPIHVKKEVKDVRCPDFPSDISQQPELGVGRVGERLRGREVFERQFGGFNIGASGSEILRKNSLDVNKDLRASVSVRSDVNLERSSRPSSKNWKNTEEEEFVWGDMNSQPTDYGGSNIRRKGDWNAENSNKLTGLHMNKWMPLETDHQGSHLNKLESFFRIGKNSGQDGKVPLFKDHEDYLSHLQTKYAPNARIDRETPSQLLSEGGRAAEAHTFLERVPHEAPLLDSGLDHNSARFPSKSEERPVSYGGSLSASISSSLPISGSLSHHTVPSSLGSLTNLISRSGDSYGQQRKQYLHPPSPSVHSPPSSSVPFPHKPPNKAEPDAFWSKPSQMGQKPFSSFHSQLGSPMPFQPQKTVKFSGTSESNKTANETSGQPSASDLLAALMKSGPNPISNPQNINIQPPLPTGPPPIHALSSHGNSAPAPVPPPMNNTVLPPLPPGPPPPSSLVRTASHISNNNTGSVGNPLSSLLRSLVAKGLISSPATETPAATIAQPSHKVPNIVLSTSTTTAVQPFSAKESPAESVAPIAAALSQSTETKMQVLIGVDFKSEIMREYHPMVIESLFDSLNHQCRICGLRFGLEEQLHGHLEWHASKKLMSNDFSSVTRKWYADTSRWIAGSVEPQIGQMKPTSSGDDVVGSVEEQCEMMVPADENQIICALCGEPFEDVYSHERDEWMYKDTVYLNLPSNQSGIRYMDVNKGQGPIVHAKCISRSSTNDLEVGDLNKGRG
ncbi:polyadenylation and cleavage factor homolog 4 [Ananas comosus]|uniref:Polyadenylation and cleavage factor homolog 4 n=1 Tax=Ananas comosus TaxID=4615 RepID=A0A6P5F5K4_ANACO|nr:polyadenylation and cleavage factor homolog 4 [Ananas comosus]